MTIVTESKLTTELNGELLTDKNHNEQTRDIRKLAEALNNILNINGEISIEATSNTQITFKLKGTDGVVRSGTINLN